MRPLPIRHTPLRPRRGRGRLAITVFALALVPAAAGCAGDAAPATTLAPTVTATVTTTTATTVAPRQTTSTQDAGEKPDTSAPQDPTMTTVTYAPPYTGTTTPGVPLPPLESNALARELIRTMEASLAIAAVLEEEGAPDTDPRISTVYALRARAQAVTARRAILDAQPSLADEAVRQLGRLLAAAANTAQGDTAAAVAQAQEHMAAMATPSKAPLQAAAALDHVIRDLAPLVPEDDGSQP